LQSSYGWEANVNTFTCELLTDHACSTKFSKALKTNFQELLKTLNCESF